MAPNNIHIAMGEGVVARGPQVVAAAGIGSCVVVTLYDRERKIGGVAHIMLPDSAAVHGRSATYQCADTAIAVLLEGLRSQGAVLSSLVAKMVGGAQMFLSYENGVAGIGRQNIRSVKHLLRRAQIPLVGWDLAGHHGRSVEFHLASGKLIVKALGKADKQF